MFCHKILDPLSPVWGSWPTDLLPDRIRPVCVCVCVCVRRGTAFIFHPAVNHIVDIVFVCTWVNSYAQPSPHASASASRFLVFVLFRLLVRLCEHVVSE